MSDNPPVKAPIDVEDEDVSYRARWASMHIRENLAAIQKDIDALPNEVDRTQLVPIAKTLDIDPHEDKQDKDFKVGIVGAGCAGLFTAMIFDHLKDQYGLNVTYEILEAANEDRLGGRLYTHYFKDVEKAGDHDYYDVGAMRFPQIKIMKRTFQLFDKLGMKKVDPQKQKPSKGDLIPYYLQGVNCPQLYNDVQVVPKKDGPQPTGKTFNISGVIEPYLSQSPGTPIQEQIDTFTKVFKEGNPKIGFENLRDNGDQFSVRGFLTSKGINYSTIEWLETYNYGNRWYDQAFSEMVLEDMDFNHDKPWSCVEGGAQEIARNMARSLKQKNTIQYDKRVTAMKLRMIFDHPPPKPDDEVIDLTVKGEEKAREYDAVFNSAPLGSMQRMELTGLNLNWGTKQAIRSLGYGASCKVGIRFKSLWWMGKDFNITQGGVAKTDLPLRACVYPSYNIYKEDEGKAGVLLVSYSWSQEAQRIASLINRKSPKDEEELRDVLIRDLARLHSKSKPADGWEQDFAKVYKIISEAYESHFAYDWYGDPHTSGAFAYFGPGQFKNMYPWVTRNNGKHVIIGEAASAHHAWVVGALESAVRGVYQFLFRHSGESKSANAALQAYNGGKIAGPFGPLPAEYDRSEDVKQMASEHGQAEKADPSVVPLASEGEWAREQVLFETIRIRQGGDQIDSSLIKTEQIAPLLQVTVKA